MSTAVLVLGAGRVGSVMAADLAADAALRITLADASEAALARAAARIDALHGAAIAVERADLADAAAVGRLAAAHELVVGALPSTLGLAALRAVIGAGRPCCDVSFMPEDPRVLHEEAEAAGVTVVVDCGVAPGLSHMLAGRAAAALDPCDEIEILVGGLPRERRWPFQYKAPFAPADVVEEYVRPARYVAGGRVVVREALSEIERVDFPGLGTLEAFNTDGLRTLLDTLDVPDIREKTLRYPGHAELMAAFRAAGLFATEPVEVRGARVVPRDLFSALVFPQWQFEEGEADLTVMSVTASGRRAGGPVRWRWDLRDELDPGTGFASMSRTTAFPATITARLLLEGAIRQRGVVPPERLGEDEALLDRVLEGLRRRGVRVRFGEERQ